MPVDGRGITGWIYGVGKDAVGITGKDAGDQAGVLMFKDVLGKSKIDRWTWNHLALVRDDADVRVYLNGQLEIKATDAARFHSEEMFFGGRSDGEANFEGRLDEIAVFRRSLSEAEIRELARPAE